ncbi:hypothetical protein SAMN04487787_12349 [Kosakonia sacchari]|nr:hypothetical protein SAMN04487787_12349 [Kosakonia sacchari]
MKELTAHEMQYASGGILFSAAGALLGGGIGALIDLVLPGTDHFSFGDTGLSMGLLGGIAADAIGVVGTLGAIGLVGAVGVGVAGAGVVGVGLLCLSPLLLFI